MIWNIESELGTFRLWILGLYYRGEGDVLIKTPDCECEVEGPVQKKKVVKNGSIVTRDLWLSFVQELFTTSWWKACVMKTRVLQYTKPKPPKPRPPLSQQRHSGFLKSTTQSLDERATSVYGHIRHSWLGRCHPRVLGRRGPCHSEIRTREWLFGRGLAHLSHPRMSWASALNMRGVLRMMKLGSWPKPTEERYLSPCHDSNQVSSKQGKPIQSPRIPWSDDHSPKSQPRRPEIVIFFSKIDISRRTRWRSIASVCNVYMVQIQSTTCSCQSVQKDLSADTSTVSVLDKNMKLSTVKISTWPSYRPSKRRRRIAHELKNEGTKQNVHCNRIGIAVHLGLLHTEPLQTYTKKTNDKVVNQDT